MKKLYSLLLFGCLMSGFAWTMEDLSDLEDIIDPNDPVLKLAYREDTKNPLKRSRDSRKAFGIESADKSSQSNKKIKSYSQLTQAEKDKLILLAADNGNTEDLEALLLAGADKEAHDECGNTPLMIASENGYLACVEILLDQGAEVNTTNEEGITALHNASEKGHLVCVKTLLNAGANREEDSNSYGEFPLSYAAGNNHKACMEALLDNPPYCKDYIETALRFCDGYCNNNNDTKKLLLKAQLNSPLSEEEKNDQNSYLLHYAAEINYPEALKELLEAGLFIDASNFDFGYTALHIAAQKGHTECVKILLDHGASKEIEAYDEDYSGDPLETAVWNERTECIKLLTQKPCTEASLLNAVHKAIEWDKPTALKTLIDAKAPLKDALYYVAKGKDSWKDTFRPSLEIIKLLIACDDVDLNYQDRTGDTALHHAAKNGNTELVQYLIEHNADVTITNNGGLTYRDYALAKGHTEILELKLSEDLEKQKTLHTLSFKDGEYSSLWIRNISETIQDLAEDIVNLEKQIIDLKDISVATWSTIAPHLRTLYFIASLNKHKQQLKSFNPNLVLTKIDESIAAKYEAPIKEALRKLSKETLIDITNAANYLNIEALLEITNEVLTQKSIEKAFSTDIKKLPKDLKRKVLLAAQEKIKTMIKSLDKKDN